VQECDRCGAGLRWGLLKQVRKCPMACSVTVPAIRVSTVLFAWLDNF
jgi:hypothetical protein